MRQTRSVRALRSNAKRGDEELPAELEEASVLGYADKVKHLIKNIRSHNTSLADALAVLNVDYEYDIILN